MFIVYLKNAEAARVAQTLRAMLTGGDGGGLQSSGSTLSPQAPIMGGAPPTGAAAIVARDGAAAGVAVHRGDVLLGQRRDDHRRHGEQRARHHGAGAGLQQSARDHREARRPPRAGVRRGADRRSVGRQGGRVRHPVAGAVRLQLDADAGDRRHQLRRARKRQQHHRHRGQSGHRRPGTGARRDEGHGDDTRASAPSPTSRSSRARSKRRSAPTSCRRRRCSRSTTRRRGSSSARTSSSSPAATRPRAAPTTVNPFQTFERRDVGLVLRVKPQITEGGTIRLVLYQEVSRVDDISID